MDRKPGNDFVSDQYRDIMMKVEKNQQLTENDRRLFTHDYIQRYSKRILNDLEYSQYQNNKTLGQVSGIGFAFCIPMNLIFMRQASISGSLPPIGRQVHLFTLVVAGAWFFSKKSQEDHMDKLSTKYFGQMSDSELVTYDHT